MIGRKTAALIAGSVQAGAMLATDDERVVDAYRRFGWALGLAFQLNDDLLGIWGDEPATGKEPSDIAARKKTLPLLYALRGRRAAPTASGCDAILRRRATSRRPPRSTRRAPSSSASAPGSTRATAPRPTATRRSRELARVGIVDGEARERLERIVRPRSRVARAISA